MIRGASLYSSFLAFQAQHASSGHDKIIISAHRNFQDGIPEENKEQPLPSFFDNGDPSTLQGWDRRRDRARDYTSCQEVDSQQISLGLCSQRLLSRRQTTIRDRRGALPGPKPPKLQLYVPSEPTARALHRLLINAVDERVRLPSWSQATQGLRGEDHSPPRTTRLRLQYLARLPSRMDPTNDKNFSVRDLSPAVGSGGGEDLRLFRYATMEQPRLVRPEGCCDSYVYLCKGCGL